MRSGHTEAAVDLCKLAGLPPVAVICELANDDGTVMVGPQIEAFADKHKLKRISVADLIAYRQAREKLVERVAGFPGRRRRSANFRATPIARRSIRCCISLSCTARSATDATCRRACIGPTSSATFSAAASSRRVLKRFKDGGARRARLSARRLGGRAGQSCRRRAGKLGRGARATQWREIGLGAQILRDLGVSSIRLRTDNPRKYVGLSGFGIEIAAVEPLEG